MPPASLIADLTDIGLLGRDKNPVPRPQTRRTKSGFASQNIINAIGIVAVTRRYETGFEPGMAQADALIAARLKEDRRVRSIGCPGA